ncbi:MAG: hypothetical protein K0B37_02010 [Bacteroidales bacterium]|nr:hypothetical protein [Bacteroidales bacterium]
MRSIVFPLVIGMIISFHSCKNPQESTTEKDVVVLRSIPQQFGPEHEQNVKSENTFTIPEKDPAPVIALEVFDSLRLGDIRFSEFDHEMSDYLVQHSWNDSGRLGHLPVNFAAGGLVVFDNIYYYALDFNNIVRRVNQFTREETIHKIPVEKQAEQLNLWEGKLYFRAAGSVISFDPESGDTTLVVPVNRRPSQIAILDGRLYFSSALGGFFARDLETGAEKLLIDIFINRFSVSEDLFVFRDSTNIIFLIDPHQGVLYETGIKCGGNIYHHDRLLFSGSFELPYTEENISRPSQGFLTMHTENDSLVMVFHMETFLSVFKGEFIGLTEGVQPVLGWYRFVSDDNYGTTFQMHSPIFQGGTWIENVFVTDERIVVYYSYLSYPYLYHDMNTEKSERIQDPEDFKKNNPRATSPLFEVMGDSIIIAETADGQINISLAGEQDENCKIVVSGRGEPEIYNLPYQRKFVSLAAFYNNKVLLRLPGGEEGYLTFPNTHLDFCLDTEQLQSKRPFTVISLTPYRDGYLYQGMGEERIITCI